MFETVLAVSIVYVPPFVHLSLSLLALLNCTEHRLWHCAALLCVVAARASFFGAHFRLRRSAQVFRSQGRLGAGKHVLLVAFHPSPLSAAPEKSTAKCLITIIVLHSLSSQEDECPFADHSLSSSLSSSLATSALSERSALVASSRFSFSPGRSM